MRFTCKPDGRFEVEGREVWFTATRNLRQWASPLLLSEAALLQGNTAPQGFATWPLGVAGGTTEGGHYAAVAAGADWFLPAWIDYANGYPQLVMTRVEVR